MTKRNKTCGRKKPASKRRTTPRYVICCASYYNARGVDVRATLSCVDLVTDREVEFCQWWHADVPESVAIAEAGAIIDRYGTTARVYIVPDSMPLRPCEVCDCGEWTHAVLHRDAVQHMTRN